MLKTEAYSNSILFLALSKKNGYKAGVLYAYKGDGFIWDRNSTAYRTNSAGALELMGSDVPRVDYSNTCPELLIEKSSTNLLLRSQEFDNASWTKINVSISPDSITAPDGTLTADTITATLSGNAIYQSISSSGDLCLSCYIKAGTSDFVFFEIFDVSPPTDYIAIFDLSNGTYVGNGGYSNVDSYKIKDVGNGWYRISVIKNVGVVGAHNFVIGVAQSGNLVNAVVGTNIYLWGAQLEQSTYVTSYIPTTSASVTRLKDVVYNNTIDFTTLKGTIFIRARIFSSSYSKVDTLFSLSDSTTDNYITCSTNASRSIFIETLGGAVDSNSYNYSLPSDGIYSIAIGYDFSGINNNLNIAINGVLKRANATQINSCPTYLDRLELGGILGTLTQVDNRIIGVQWFNTQLDDSSLAALTTA